MCGFVGVIGVERALPLLYVGLQAIQHRGQDAAGVGTWDGERFHLHKDLGMVAQAVPSRVVTGMPGGAGIGHVRYPTHGSATEPQDAQPFLTRRPGILAAHNGNIVNAPELEAQLRDQGMIVLSRSDSETVMLVLAEELTRIRPSGHTADDLVLAATRLSERVRGSYSLTALLILDGRATLIGLRDPHGIRPGVYGTRGDGAWMVASESVALDALGFDVVGELPIGGVVLLRAGDEPVVREVAPEGGRACVFEQIYFARADSVMGGARVNAVRWSLGEALADEWAARGLTADVVVAIPDTSRPAAMAMAERLGIPTREGFIKNRYSGRTFIMPDQHTREAALRVKLNPIGEVFEGRSVILVDDSIVRGNTMRRIAAMVRKTRPKAVHLAVFSPPVRNPCFYGIDMPSHDELLAAHFEPEEAPGPDGRMVEMNLRLATYFGVDSLTYLSRSGLRAVAGADICAACFDGDYVVPIREEERGDILRERRSA